MKAYEIRDFESDANVGVLLYYEQEKAYIIELESTLDEWTAPLLFSGYVKSSIYTIPRDISLAWIRERVIPSGRQNINSILNHHRLKEYDEMKLLELSEGKCSQDSLYIRRIDDLPAYVLERMNRNLVDVTLLSDRTLLCFFKDDSVKRVKLDFLGNEILRAKIEKRVKKTDIDKIIRNGKLYNTARLGADGYFLTFNNSIDIPSSLLYDVGKEIDIKFSEIQEFVKKNIVDTTESCNILGCTRQNISYKIRREEFPVLKHGVNGNLYLKGDVEKNIWG
ncbi:MAG: hypothetical protein K6E28_06330 [Eubacterium sp.]|nr:hypothetical protein [Eubacterium sp.]